MDTKFALLGWHAAYAATRALALATTLVFGVASTAHAQDELASTLAAAEDVGGGARINLSGKLRMLSQRIPASACYLQAAVSTEDSGAMLVAAQAEFATIVAALRDGNSDLGVHGEETRRKTLRGLELLEGLWEPVNAGADEMTAGNGNNETVQQIAIDSAPLLEMAKKLVTVISEQYSNPGELLLRDSLAIDVAGRQRMLAQRASKNVCLLSTGLATDTAITELSTAAETFGSSLQALRNGMAAAGIQQPPTAEIATGLDAVIANWQIVEPMIERVLAGEQLDSENLSIMFALSNQLTAGMNAVVGMYTEVSDTDT